LVREKLNQLSNDVTDFASTDFARAVNRDLMEIAGPTCTGQILTTGNIPRKQNRKNPLDVWTERAARRHESD
jgi:hypothetical protein